MQLITTLCDRCYDSDIHSPSDGTMLIEVNSRGTEIDLCTKHSEELTDLLAPFYEAGRRPDHISIRPSKPSNTKTKSRITSGDHECDFENCTRSFSTAQGLAMHRTRTHGTHGLQDISLAGGDPFREVEGETPLERKRRKDRERYARKQAQSV